MSDNIYAHANGSFEKLTLENWADWSTDLRFLLESNDPNLWGYVDGTIARPNGPTIATEQGVAAARIAEANLALVNVWNTNTAKACTVIWNATSSRLKRNIREHNGNAARMYETLRTITAVDSSNATKQGLHNRFNDTKNSGEIKAFFRKLRDIRDQLADTDDPISNSHFVSHIMTNVSKELRAIAFMEANKDGATPESVMRACEGADELLGTSSYSPAASSSRGRFARGSCIHHPFSVTHDTSMCVREKYPVRRSRSPERQRRSRSPDRGRNNSRSRPSRRSRTPIRRRSRTPERRRERSRSKSRNRGDSYRPRRREKSKQRRKSSPSQSPRRSTRESKKEMQCFHCAEYGHSAYDCEVKIKAQKARAKHYDRSDSRGRRAHAVRGYSSLGGEDETSAGF